jgi:hypothetical protein
MARLPDLCVGDQPSTLVVGGLGLRSRGPNMRIRLLGGVPVAAPSASKPTVALM